MDAFTTLGIIVSVTAIFAVPIFFIVILIALHLADCRIAARSQRTTIELNLIVQVDDGALRALPAHQVQRLLADAGSRQTVRIIDPAKREFDEYRGGRLVRRGELVQTQTAIALRDR